MRYLNGLLSPWTWKHGHYCCLCWDWDESWTRHYGRLRILIKNAKSAYNKWFIGSGYIVTLNSHKTLGGNFRIRHCYWKYNDHYHIFFKICSPLKMQMLFNLWSQFNASRKQWEQAIEFHYLKPIFNYFVQIWTETFLNTFNNNAVSKEQFLSINESKLLIEIIYEYFIISYCVIIFKLQRWVPDI